MVALVIAAHGEMAPALLASAEMIAGPSEDVRAVTFSKSEGPDDLLKKYEEASQELGSDVLFLVDLFGGSPFNAAARFAAAHPGTDVVTGVNLPMLVEVLMSRAVLTDVPALVQQARTSGTSGVRTFSDMNTTSASDAEDDEGDEL
ncbi:MULTISPECIES: PTS sugar transporter subunit IIA [Acidipropionibacterium]|uniref:PTS sugar transporter subunit IIA n=1 Tax=Acidipropionibacterium TaxID=1912215 RepID=UPI0004238772|nr:MULTISPECIES: PTS sugar transporter subunit IIA [Acidipropionibacterium]